MYLLNPYHTGLELLFWDLDLIEGIKTEKHWYGQTTFRRRFEI